MENIMTLPNGKLYRDSIKQYFTINKDMKYLGEKGESFMTRVINKQIIKMLPPRIRMEYIMNSGETKDDKEDILEAMDGLDTFVKLTRCSMLQRKLTQRMVETKTRTRRRNPTENPMAKPIKEAAIRRRIHAKSMKESMTGANAQTTHS
jgi:hypothetical protein